MSRRQRIALIFGVIFLTLGATSYYLWTRASALMVLRWFVREAGIPVEVRSASWDLRLGTLAHNLWHGARSGEISDLSLEIYYKPLDTDFSIHTPVRYQWNKDHWSIQLRPELRVGTLPPATGVVNLELDVRRRGQTAEAGGATVEFHLREVHPFEIKTPSVSLNIKSWVLDGTVNFIPSTAQPWIAALDATLIDTQIALPGKETLSVASIVVKNDMTWPKAPPFPINVKSHVTAAALTFTGGKLFIEEPSFELDTSVLFDGKRFTELGIAIERPFQLTSRGSFGEGKLEQTISFTGSLEELVTKRLGDWIGPFVPVLHRAKATGTLAAAGHLTLDASGPRFNGAVALKASRIELPSQQISAENVEVRLPISQPDKDEWGAINIDALDFHSVRLHKLALYSHVSSSAFDLSTADEKDVDHPVRQSLWGGSIDIAELYIHAGGGSPLEFTAAVRSDPLRISQAQKDLCFSPSHPIAGTVQFNYPNLVHDKTSLHLMGSTELKIFNGAARLGDLHLALDEENPILRLDFTWTDLDLQALGEWTRLGDMRGSLQGALSNAKFALTPLGLMPLEYDFTIRGSERGGTAMRFYGRAVEGIMGLLGSNKDEMPWFARLGVSIGTTWLNLLPARIDYFGFYAKAGRDWTELGTFDPPGSKKHYLLMGSAFKIPLNASDVYPVLMRTNAFQNWLWKMETYFKGRQANGKVEKTDEECTPLW